MTPAEAASVERAKAFTEGFLLSHFLERGWTFDEALEKALNPYSPDDLNDILPERLRDA